jgi:disulfide bond formation protein DsbB
MVAWIKQYALHIAWFQALVATLGSLFFSEVMGWTPCVLCWYQRIFMYPLVFILTVGILLKDKKLALYVLPLSITGWLIAAYHNLLYYGVIQEVCKQGVSCTTRFFAWFGFITIPLLSLIAFTVITSCLLIYRRENHDR